MHVCNTAHVWTSQRLAIWSTFWLHTTFCFVYFGTYAAPLPSSSLWTYATPLPSSPFLSLSLSFVVCQNLLNPGSFHGTNRQTLLMTSLHHAKIQNIQTQIANLKSHIPSFAFHSEPHANAQDYTTALLLSQDTLQSSAMLQILLNSMPAFW